MKHIIYIILFLISFNGVAQEFADKKYYLVDSLIINELSKEDRELLKSSLNDYHSAKNDTSRINALHLICERMMHHDWEKYQFYQYNLLKQFSGKKLNKNEIEHVKTALSHAVNNIAIIYVMRGNVELGLKFFHKSLILKKQIDDKPGIADALNNLGRLQYGLGNIPLAMEYYENGLKIMEELRDLKGMTNAYMSIGIIHKAQNNHELAMNYYQKCLKIFLKLDDKIGLGEAYNNIGVIHKLEGRLDKALYYNRKSLAIREVTGDIRGKAESYTNIAQMFQDRGELDSAMFYSQKCLKLHQELNDIRGVALTYNDIGEIYLELGELTKAQDMGIKGLELGNQMGIPIIINRHANLLCLVYEAKGDGINALKMHRLYSKMTDSLNNEFTQKASIRQQAKYEFEKAQVIRDNENDKKLAIEKEAKAKQQVITYGVIIILVLVIIFLYIVYNRLKVTRNQKEIIEIQKKIVDEKNLEITDSIIYARRIQSAILPPSKLVKEYLKESFIIYKPKDVVAGDFYWMEHKGGKVLFAAADCTGHGVPGAMVSVVCNNALNRSVREHGLTDPGEILNKTREIVIQEFEKSEEDVKDGMDIALCSLEGNKLKYAGAHNPLWIIRKDAIAIEEIKANKQPIGQFDNPEPYTTHSFDLEAGDSIYVFSDGYVDQFGGEKGKKFKARAFRELLLSIQSKSMEAQKAIIDESFEKWKGNLDQIDDVCVIGVRI